jgi:nitrite reductase/ring-hydroxylating ferredoxin subunit/uncharacterized membrane protein
VGVTSPLPAALAERIESFDALDEPAEQIGQVVRDAIPDGPVKDALSGTWMGHALHPLLTDIPIGTWTSAMLLDLIGEDEAARKLIGAGLAATLPTVITGWNDWADTEPASDAVRRTGILHALSNGLAAGLMTASWVARRGGKTGGGKLLSMAGMGLLGAGGWLGGHLSYAQGVGVDTTVFDDGPAEWTRVEVGSLEEGRPACALVGTTPVMLVRVGGSVKALHNRCTHRGGSLAEGEIDGNTVTCPLHGSVFSLDDGSVERGPAAYPQPVFEVRETGDGIEVRRVAR